MKQMIGTYLRNGMFLCLGSSGSNILMFLGRCVGGICMNHQHEYA